MVYIARNGPQLLKKRVAAGYLTCVGLDPVLEQIPSCVTGENPALRVLAFLKQIVWATRNSAGAYKPNAAFFEALGPEGETILGILIDYIHDAAPGVPVILDAKRGDIGKTNKGYVKSAFDWKNADGITISPYLGREANQPFLDCKDKIIFVLARTSNPGAGEFQDRQVLATPEEAEELGLPKRGGSIPLHQVVTRNVATTWNVNGNCGLVAGATAPHELASIRKIVPNMFLLIPGVGAQGGTLEDAAKNGMDAEGGGFIVNQSSSVLYASSGEDFAEAANRVVESSNNALAETVEKELAARKSAETASRH